MKTRKYFDEKVKALRLELQEEIKSLLHKKCKIGRQWDNFDDANRIGFINNVTGTFDEGEIDHIYIGKTEISIYPKGNDLCQNHLTRIMDIGDLMLIHHIAKLQIK